MEGERNGMGRDGGETKQEVEKREAKRASRVKFVSYGGPSRDLRRRAAVKVNDVLGLPDYVRSGLYPNTPPQTEGRSRVNNIFAWRKERDGVLAHGSGSSPRLAQELALGSGSGLHITSLRRLVRLVSRISSDASPVPPLRMRRSFGIYGGRSVRVCLSTFAPIAARSSCQLPLVRHITRDRDGLWKDIRRTECAPKRHNLPVGGPLSTLPGLVVTASLWLRAASISSRETHRLIGPTSTILLARIRLLGIRST
ncbi:hypothetical protein EDB84DRAFT_1442957, partial [Lactarius hengduanensis]